MFVRAFVFSSVLLGLAGCDQVTDRVSNGLSVINPSEDVTNEGIRTLSLLDGDVRVRGPEGYCVDQAASDARRGFSVLAGCALISDQVLLLPRLDGLITVQFGEEGTASVAGNEDAFAAFIQSDAGRAVLSANGDAATLSEVEAVTDISGVLVRLTDATGPAFEGTSGAQWRGFMDIGDRLTTVSVLSFERNELTRSEAERLLIVAMNELAEVNTAAQPVDENT